MRQSVLLFIMCLTLLLSGCNSFAKYDNTEEGIGYVNLVDDISAATFEDYSHIFIHAGNIEAFEKFYDSNAEIVNDYFASKGKLIVSWADVDRNKIEGRLKESVCEISSDMVDERMETIATIYYMTGGALSTQDICVPKGTEYDTIELIQLTIDRTLYKDDWKDVKTNGPLYAGSKGYTFFDGIKAEISIQYDIYTLQDTLGFDEYYVILNVEGNTQKDGMGLSCVVNTPTDGMFYIESQPQSHEMDMVYLSHSSIVWKQVDSDIKIEAEHLENGKCWNIDTEDDDCRVKLGIKWNSPEEKQEVVFHGEVVLTSDEYAMSLRKNLAYRSDVEGKK